MTTKDTDTTTGTEQSEAESNVETESADGGEKDADAGYPNSFFAPIQDLKSVLTETVTSASSGDAGETNGGVTDEEPSEFVDSEFVDATRSSPETARSDASEAGGGQEQPVTPETTTESSDAADSMADLPPEAREVLEDVKAYFAEEPEGEFLGAVPEEFIEQSFFDFSYLDEYNLVEWKWLNKPYAYVSILEREGEDKYRYHVTEPDIDEFESYVYDYLLKLLRNHLMYQDLEEGQDRASVFETKAEDIIRNNATVTVDEGSLRKILYYLRRDFVNYGAIDPLMRDDQIEDISCDGVDIPVYVYHFEYRDLPTNVQFNRSELLSFILRLAQQAGESISVSDPLVDGSLPDGSRVQLTFGGEISTRGPNFTIRKFSEIPYTPVQLIKWGTFSVEQMAYFWLAIENNRSLIFAGGTGSGKTTSMNAVSFFIPEDSKIVSIEDTREITLPHNNWVQSLTRSSIGEQTRGEVSMYQLLRSALRQRPEYILVGEIRTQPKVAFTFFQSIGTGHTAYTTIHADSVDGVVNRLQNDPLNIPMQMIQELDIISIQKQTYLDGQRVRRNSRVTEITPTQDEEGLRIQEIYRRDADSDSFVQTNNSSVLDDIAEDRGWSRTELNRELRDREEILEYLIENDIDEYGDVVSVLRMFHRNRDYLMQRIRSEELTVDDLDLEMNIDLYQ